MKEYTAAEWKEKEMQVLREAPGRREEYCTRLQREADEALIHLANRRAQKAEKCEAEMCNKKPVCSLHAPVYVPNCTVTGVEYVPDTGCTHTCTCDKNFADEPLDYTRDEFANLMGMLMGVREYINQIDIDSDVEEDIEAQHLAHTMEKQLLFSLQSYITDATH